MCLFKYYMAMFLVTPDKPSFRHLDSMWAFGIRTFREETLRCQPVLKTAWRRFQKTIKSSYYQLGLGIGQFFWYNIHIDTNWLIFDKSFDTRVKDCYIWNVSKIFAVMGQYRHLLYSPHLVYNSLCIFQIKVVDSSWALCFLKLHS